MSSAPSAAPSLPELSAALRNAKAWQARFEQRYLPAGFAQGAKEAGVVLLEPPLRLRFTYEGKDARVFAVDGDVARFVDPAAGTCDALRLDRSVWGRLPLAALLDPGAAQGAFTVETRADSLRLVPREPMPEVAEILVRVGADRLPASVVVSDASGNRNEFVFSSWRKVTVPVAGTFRPALPGAQPCRPEAEPGGG